MRVPQQHMVGVTVEWIPVDATAIALPDSHSSSPGIKNPPSQFSQLCEPHRFISLAGRRTADVPTQCERENAHMTCSILASASSQQSSRNVAYALSASSPAVTSTSRNS